jgi:16S rRNA (guanine527-N7)-methyltransferase
MRQQEHDVLGAGAEALKVTLGEADIERLLKLVDALERGNAQFNLTAIRDRPGMLAKHILDSLTLVPFLHGERIADVGTGAGFPGLVLAIASPQRRFSLVESVGKKARFVERAVLELELANVEVVHERAERYGPKRLFDTVASRALASLADFVAFAGHLCAPGGRLLAMKGKRPDEELRSLPKSFKVLAVHELEVPGLSDARHLVELARA